MATFKLQISTIDNNILEFKKGMWFNCDLVVPLGVQVIRMYDKSECIVSKKVYLFGYQGHRYGLEDFSTMDQFIDYRNFHCLSCLTYEDCYLTFGGQSLSLY